MPRCRPNWALAVSIVCMSCVVHGVGTAAPRGSGGASFSPTNFASSINGLFASQAPDLKILEPLMSSLQGVALGDPSLAPVFAAVQSQVQALQLNAVAEQTASASPALAAKLIAADILRDFQLPGTRSQVARWSHVYHDALPGVEKERIRAQLIMLHMESMAEALGRTRADDSVSGVVNATDSSEKKNPWKLQPSRRADRRAVVSGRLTRDDGTPDFQEGYGRDRRIGSKRTFADLDSP